MQPLRCFLFSLALCISIIGEIKAQTDFPVVEHMYQDTLHRDEVVECYFVFRNESGKTVKINSVTSSTEIIGQPRYSKEPISPGSASRVDYIIRAVHIGQQDLPVHVYLNNDSVITVRAHPYVLNSPAPAQTVPVQQVNSPKTVVASPGKNAQQNVRDSSKIGSAKPVAPPKPASPPPDPSSQQNFATHYFPVTPALRRDTVAPTTTYSNYFVFKNRSNRAVTILSASVSEARWHPENLTLLPVPKDTIRPGDSVRIDYRFQSRNAGEWYEHTISVELSNHVHVRHDVRIYVNDFYVIVPPGSEGKIDTIRPVTKPAATTCTCVPWRPEYPGGQTLFNDSLTKLTRAKVKPDTTGTCFIQMTVQADGSVTDIVVIKSIDPEYERELVKNIPKLGKWTPACRYEEDPLYEGEEWRKVGAPMKCRITIPVRIRP